MSGLGDVLMLQFDGTSGPLATPTYTDVTVDGDGFTVSTRVGRDSVGPDDLYGTGSMSVDRDNTDGSIPATGWLRGKHIRLSTRPGDTTIFDGFVDKATHDQSGAPFEAAVSLECVDTRASGRKDTAANLYEPLMTGDVIRAYNVPYTVDPMATYTEMELAKELAANECGVVYPQGSGTSFSGRSWRLVALARHADEGPVATFSDTPEADDAYPMLSRSAGGVFDLSEPEEAYRDRVEFTGLTGVLQAAEDAPADYDPVTLSRSTQCPDDNWMRANAAFLLLPHLSQQTFWRRFTVQLWPTPDDGIIDALCAIVIGDVIAVKASPVGGSRLESLLFVESLGHTIVPDRWTVEFGCSNAQAWLDAWGTDHDYLTYDAGMSYDSGLKWRP